MTTHKPRTPRLSPFQSELESWGKKLQTSITRAETLQADIRGLESRVRYFQTPIVSGFARLTGREKPQLQPGQKPPRDITGAYLVGGKRYAASIIGGEERSRSQVEAAILSDDIKTSNKQLLKNIFYTDLYSIVPALVGAGVVNNPDEALSKIAIPDNLTKEELEAARSEIAQLLSSRDREVAEEVPEEGELPPLQPPPEKRPTAVSIHSLSTQAILRSLTAPRVPQTTMTRDEYRTFLADKGWSEEDIDAEVGMTTEKLIAEAQNRKNMIESFKSEIYKLPDLTGMDILKMTIMNPPLAVLEALGTYYEHVSMPAAGWLYGSQGWRATAIRDVSGGVLTGGISDITVAYNEFKSQNPDATEREAWVYAWNKWEAPGPPVLDFILKYIIMEGVVDPLTYAGWGLVTRGLRALGPAGRTLAIGNAYVGEVIELPFDYAKYVSTKVLPKTIRQTATVFSRNSESIIKVAFEKFHKGSIPLYEMSPKQMKDAGDFVLEHLVKNPRAEDDMALAARELLAHAPFDKKTATNWAERLRKLGATDAISSDRITPQTIKDMNEIFERVFTKQTTPAEEAGALLRKLGLMEITEDTQILAEKLLADRANSIFSKALDFAAADTTRHALTALSKKQSKIYEEIATSLAYTEAIKAGRFALFTHNIEKRYVESWMHYLNRYVIRSAADSYLTFAGYGFGNVGEDIGRSVLGGVKPGRVSREDWDVYTIGLVGDPTLRARGISEMIGELREVDEGAWHNWILTFSTLWAGLPAYLVTRGKITPRRVAEKAFEVMVEMPGAFSADIRRNFTFGKAMQILAEDGGEAYELLTKALPEVIPEILQSAPKWVKRNLLRDIRNYGLTGKLTSDNIALIKRLKDKYTHDMIVKAELDDILKRYEELSPSSRSLLLKTWEDKLLFSEETLVRKDIVPYQKPLLSDISERDTLLEKLSALAKTIKIEGELTLDDFIDAWKGHPVNDYLQTIGKAAEQSLSYRNEVKAILDKRYPSGYLKVFRGHGQAGSSIQALKRDYINVTSDSKVAKEFGSLNWLLPDEREVNYVIIKTSDVVAIGAVGESELFVSSSIIKDRLSNRLFTESGASSINTVMKQLSENELDDFLRSPEKAVVDFEKLTDYLTQLEVTNPEAMSDLISGLYRMTATYGALPDQIMARATVKSRGLPVADRKLQFDTEFDRIHTFMDKAGASIDTVVDKMEADLAGRGLQKNISELEWASAKLSSFQKIGYKKGMLTEKELDRIQDVLERIVGVTIEDLKEIGAAKSLRESFNNLGIYRARVDSKLKELSKSKGFNEPYRQSLRSYLDLSTTARKVISEAKSQDIAFRSSYFADATQKEMRTPEFWEQFYASVMSHWKNTSKKLAVLNAQLHQSINNINTALGSKARVRSPIKVVDRPLAPADIGKLVGARGDDLSQMLLNTLVPEGDKDYFVEYIMGLVKEGDSGFTRESIGAVYDQIAASMMIDPASSSWFRIRQLQLGSLGRDLHDLYNSKLFPKEQKVAVDNFIDESVAKLDKLLTKETVPDVDIGLTERIATPEDIASLDKQVDYYMSTHPKLEDRREAEKIFFGNEGRQVVVEGKVPVPAVGEAEVATLKTSLREAAQKVVLEEDVIAFKDIVDALKKREGFEEAWRGKTTTLFKDIDTLNPDRMQEELSRMLNTGQVKDVPLFDFINDAIDKLSTIGRGDETLEDFIQAWFSYFKNPTLQRIGQIASQNPAYLTKVRSILKEQYPSGHIRIFRGMGKAGEKHLEREFTNVTSSRRTAKEFSSTTWGIQGKKDPLVDNVLVKIEDIVAIGSVDESELIIPAKVLRDRIDHPLVAPREVSALFKDYDQLRQSALDEALKWYYKEYTDYTNANMLDALMKQLFPFWTYESQRWLWLPRSFVRHPGTLSQWGRWENNTNQGYVHIPGTSIDINPFRGTVYGPWSTRLMKRDYPEYYDQLEGMGGMIGFFDFISRYGFYPNIIYGALVSQYGGATEQLGGILPAQASTPLNALIAAFPDNPIVNFISERVFPEQFRTYLTARGVDDLGGDGSLVYAKRKGNIKLTEEEESMWTQARRTTALHSVAFEQFGFARMRTDQSYALAKASAQFIEENWGITVGQQEELRRRGEKLWDIIGGLDPWETAVLQELEFFKYAGSVNPLLPGTQQEILTRIERDWSDVMTYSEAMRAEILNLQQDFLTGSERGRLGPDDFLFRVRDLYKKRREYIDKKTEANPLMLLDNRTEYYAKYRQPMPVQSPYNELMDLFFSIELEDTVDPATGERIVDWDKFWANREMIQDAIPEDDRAKWDTFLSRHTAPIMEVWHDVYKTYFKKYYSLYDEVLKKYSPEEQRLINEYLYLERTGQQLDRQALIKEMISEKDGKQLISSFRTTVSNEREALRYANPHLDAWLYYWSRTSSFKTRKAEEVYKQLAKQTGRTI